CSLHWAKSVQTLHMKERLQTSSEDKPTYLLLRIQNQEPLKINDVLRTSDSTHALNYIPGHVLRGALVRYYLSEKGLDDKDLDTSSIFDDENMQFWNGYLELNQQRSLPFPLHLVETKEQSRSN